MKRPNIGGKCLTFLLGLLLITTISHGVFAQTGTSSVTGTVTDPQGNVVAGASVVLSNPSKNFTRTQVTNESGAYSFSSIPPDTYIVEVTGTGFKKTVISDVRALVAKPTETNVQLEIGTV